MIGKRNPWLASAAKGATGGAFEIRTVADFLKVPEERRRICLREFHSWMAMGQGVRDLLLAVGDSMQTPIPPEAITFRTDVFRWHDDGKATARDRKSVV